MDKNKQAKLGEIAYVISECCGLCAHSNFHSTSNDFALCHGHGYTHLKHSEPRSLGVHRAGICLSFEPSKELIDKLGGYAQFVENYTDEEVTLDDKPISQPSR
jgi:hypothetical protein